MSNKQPCIHGNLCRAYMQKRNVILSYSCPSGCEFYEPKLGTSIEEQVKQKSLGKWYVGRTDGKSEEVVLLSDVLNVLKEAHK